MNEFNDLEAELNRLRPRAPSPELASRIESTLAQEVTATPTAGVLPRRAKVRMNWFALGLGAAATAAVVMLALVSIDRPAQQRRPVIAAAEGLVAASRETSGSSSLRSGQAASSAVATPSSSFVPDGLTRVVYHTRDEGLVYSSNTDSPARRRRSRARETLQWKERGTGASLRVSYPTEEVELIPVSGQ